MRNQMTNVLKCVGGMKGQLSGDVLWKKIREKLTGEKLQGVAATPLGV